MTLIATLDPVSGGLAPAPVSVTVMDASGDAYQLAAGTLPADGRPHRLTAIIGRPGRASYPLRLTAITVGYVLPAKSPTAAVLKVHGPALSGWTASVSSPELSSARQAFDVVNGSALPEVLSWQPGRAGPSALTFSTGYGESAAVTSFAGEPGIAEPVDGQVLLTASRPQPTTPIPAIATSAFLGSSGAAIGSTVQETIGGVNVPVRIVALASHFPTVTASNATGTSSSRTSTTASLPTRRTRP